MQTTLDDMFDAFVNKQSIFSNKTALQTGYTPDNLPHRREQINQLGQILAPALRLEVPSNVFIYGKTGTGKTAVTKYVGRKLRDHADRAGVDAGIVYLNSKLGGRADTEYRLFAELGKLFGASIPKTGLPTDQVYNMFINAIDSKKRVAIIVIDEIDYLVRKQGSDVLYNLTRMNSELKNAKISIIGITNNLKFSELLDPRVISSLGEEELVFPPYNALQLQNILEERTAEAFVSDVVETEVILKCAAYAAKEHGDARRALDLLRVSGEIAERNGEDLVVGDHVDIAESKMDVDRVIELIKKQPQQSQAVLYTIISLQNNNKPFGTGDIYDLYCDVCKKSNLKPLTHRRVSELIYELDMLGVINSKVVSRGRGGRTREVQLSISGIATDKIVRFLRAEFTY